MLGLIGLLLVINSCVSTLSQGDATVQSNPGARRTGRTSKPSRIAMASGLSIFGGKDNAETNQDVSAKAGVAASASAHQQLILSQIIDQKCESQHQLSASSSSDDEFLTSVDHRFASNDRSFCIE